jgi:glycosyltransferase involved in cell wall biosynthesis
MYSSASHITYSFIVTTYNSEGWIQQCISSVLAQSFTGFDILVLDSGSSDGTLAYLKSIKDSRIKIYTTPNRLGIVENWQRITGIPRNEFMTILGHDDILYPDYLASIDQLIQQFPDAGLYQTHFNFIDGNGQLIRACHPMNPVILPGELLEAVLQNTIEITATGFMVRSKDYDAVGGIAVYPNLLYADIELWLKLILDNYLAISRANCFEFRLHINNTSKSTGTFRFTAFEMLIDFLDSLKKTSAKYQLIIDKNIGAFLKNHVVGSCHKLIYIPKGNRNQVTMDGIIASAKRCARKIAPYLDFKPEQYAGIRVAKLVDSSSLLRKMFLFYKGFQKRMY